MEDYIQISKLNDFVFCPYSLYLHTIYDNLRKDLYQQEAQTRGTLAHEKIDRRQYSSSLRYWQGTTVYSRHLGILGKIDIFDAKDQILIERKYKINKIYRGYKWQLYAQTFCLQERLIYPKKICLHSLSDNKRYELPLPNLDDYQALKQHLNQMRNFEALQKVNPRKCQFCIYGTLCEKREDLCLANQTL